MVQKFDRNALKYQHWWLVTSNKILFYGGYL